VFLRVLLSICVVNCEICHVLHKFWWRERYLLLATCDQCTCRFSHNKWSKDDDLNGLVHFLKWFEIEISKWVLTCEPTRLTTGSSQVGLRKIQFFQKWVKHNPTHLTHGLNRFKPSWRWIDPLNPL